MNKQTLKEIEKISGFLPPVFRRNGEGTVFTGVCLSTPGGGGGRVPTLDWEGGTYLGWRVSTLDGDTYLGQGHLPLMGGYLPWTGVPTLDGGVPTLDGGVPTLDKGSTYL